MRRSAPCGPGLPAGGQPRPPNIRANADVPLRAGRNSSEEGGARRAGAVKSCPAGGKVAERAARIRIRLAGQTHAVQSPAGHGCGLLRFLLQSCYSSAMASATLTTHPLIREAVYLHEIAQLSDADIARATGVARSTARAWLAHTRSPTGDRGERLIELSAMVERLARLM